MPSSGWTRYRWRVQLAVAVLVLASLVTHYVFHEPVWPALLVVLAVAVVGTLTERNVRRHGDDGEQEPPRRNN